MSESAKVRDMNEVTKERFLEDNPWATAAEKHGDAWVQALLAVAYELWRGRSHGDR